MHTPEYDEHGRVARIIVEREPEFDAQQYELSLALIEYEASINELGIPLDEAMDALADPDNPRGTHRYVATMPARDWSVFALEQEQKKPEWSGENYLRSRKFGVKRVER